MNRHPAGHARPVLRLTCRVCLLQHEVVAAHQTVVVHHGALVLLTACTTVPGEMSSTVLDVPELRFLLAASGALYDPDARELWAQLKPVDTAAMVAEGAA